MGKVSFRKRESGHFGDYGMSLGTLTHVSFLFIHAYQLSKAIHEDGIKVVLAGHGADELFCGYRRHIVARLLKYLSRGVGPLSTSTLNQDLPQC